MSQATSGRQNIRCSHPEPLPADANGKRLCELFNYPWQFITATLDHPHYKPKWETITHYPLRPRNLWTQGQDPNQLIGVHFGHTTSYALIDIDAKSQYLNPTAISDLQYALETIGICRVMILRSSWSGSLHIHIPLPEIDYIQHTATHSPGYYQWCRHRHEIRAQAKAWAKAAESYHWPLGSKPKRSTEHPQLDGTNNIVNFNQERATDAQNRIRAAVEQLRADNQLPDGMTARATAISPVANTSIKTLYKNLEYWHPKHLNEVYILKTCKTPVATSDSASPVVRQINSTEFLKRPYNKLLHTLYLYMKGGKYF